MELTWEVRHGAGDVPRVRHAVSTALREAAVRADYDAVELVVTELVTNALIHGAGPISVTVSTRDDTVVVEVTDAATYEVPHRVEADAARESGRGLLLVSVLASRWGVRTSERGKTVWAEIAGTSHAISAHAAHGAMPGTVPPARDDGTSSDGDGGAGAAVARSSAGVPVGRLRHV